MYNWCSLERCCWILWTSALRKWDVDHLTVQSKEIYPLEKSICLLDGSNHQQGFLAGSVVKNPPATQETQIASLGQGDSPGGGHGTPLQYTCLENPTDGGAWWAAVHGVTESWTRLKSLSRSRAISWENPFPWGWGRMGNSFRAFWFAGEKWVHRGGCRWGGGAGMHAVGEEFSGK